MKINIPFLNMKVTFKRTNKYSGQITKRDYNKVFVIGFNKTGTTSIKIALESFGLRLGNQPVAEILSKDWSKGETDRIIRYCLTADAFQDLPFSKPDLYKELDKNFPNSKFILSLRDSPEQWFNSLVRFHTKRFALDKNNPPTELDLANATYRYKGFMLDNFKNYWNYPEVSLYSKKDYIEIYNVHKENVMAYFNDTPEKLLVVNLNNQGDFRRLCRFLNVETKISNFPWVNKT